MATQPARPVVSGIGTRPRSTSPAIAGLLSRGVRREIRRFEGDLDAHPDAPRAYADWLQNNLPAALGAAAQ